MLSFSAYQSYFLFSKATDMRKGFDGLLRLVRKHIPHDLMSGDVFIFIYKNMGGRCMDEPRVWSRNSQMD